VYYRLWEHVGLHLCILCHAPFCYHYPLLFSRDCCTVMLHFYGVSLNYGLYIRFGAFCYDIVSPFEGLDEFFGQSNLAWRLPPLYWVLCWYLCRVSEAPSGPVLGLLVTFVSLLPGYVSGICVWFFLGLFWLYLWLFARERMAFGLLSKALLQTANFWLAKFGYCVMDALLRVLFDTMFLVLGFNNSTLKCFILWDLLVFLPSVLMAISPLSLDYFFYEHGKALLFPPLEDLAEFLTRPVCLDGCHLSVGSFDGNPSGTMRRLWGQLWVYGSLLFPFLPDFSQVFVSEFYWVNDDMCASPLLLLPETFGLYNYILCWLLYFFLKVFWV